MIQIKRHMTCEAIPTGGFRISAPIEKPCNKCGIVKGLKEYYFTTSSRDGRSHTCRECAKAHARLDYHIKKKSRRERVRAAIAAEVAQLLCERGRREAAQ